MTFSQLTSGTRIHVLEITGTFKKNTTYSFKHWSYYSHRKITNY